MPTPKGGFLRGNAIDTWQSGNCWEIGRNTLTWDIGFEKKYWFWFAWCTRDCDWVGSILIVWTIELQVVPQVPYEVPHLETHFWKQNLIVKIRFLNWADRSILPKMVFVTGETFLSLKRTNSLYKSIFDPGNPPGKGIYVLANWKFVHQNKKVFPQ